MVRTVLHISGDGTTGEREKPVVLPEAPPFQPPSEYATVRLPPGDMNRLKARTGDLLYIADARRWLGGLRSIHARDGQPHDANGVLIASDAYESGNFVPGRPVIVEKLL